MKIREIGTSGAVPEPAIGSLLQAELASVSDADVEQLVKKAVAGKEWP